ncbi:MAG TPA: hypothetical protein EYN11_02855, partial [Phycisphaerales bacterium]|nr:hypothetical protein [Phycisphaerales bacterium]
SNLFNILFVLPITIFVVAAAGNQGGAKINFIKIPSTLESCFYIVVMLSVTIFAMYAMKTGTKITKTEARIFVLIYVLFLVFAIIYKYLTTY